MTGSPGNLLVIRQPESGYRFSIDSVLLAGFSAPHCRGRVLDLGMGCGVLLLLLSRIAPDMVSGVGVEIQPALCAFAERNFRENGPARRLGAVRGDFRRDAPGADPGTFALVVANPPYGRAGHGRRNPHPQREAARHEIHCSLLAFPLSFLEYLRNIDGTEMGPGVIPTVIVWLAIVLGAATFICAFDSIIPHRHKCRQICNRNVLCHVGCFLDVQSTVGHSHRPEPDQP